jgi:hypothetical protein
MNNLDKANLLINALGHECNLPIDSECEFIHFYLENYLNLTNFEFYKNNREAYKLAFTIIDNLDNKEQDIPEHVGIFDVLENIFEEYDKYEKSNQLNDENTNKINKWYFNRFVEGRGRFNMPRFFEANDNPFCTAEERIASSMAEHIASLKKEINEFKEDLKKSTSTSTSKIIMPPYGYYLRLNELSAFKPRFVYAFMQHVHHKTEEELKNIDQMDKGMFFKFSRISEILHKSRAMLDICANAEAVTEKWLSEHKAVEAAKLAERDRVIAELSHHIKNIVSSTVIDPLENLRVANEYKQYIVEDALKGAGIIRQIVNAMNLSFKGSLEDFEHDAVNNSGRNSMDLQNIVIESFRYSIANIFEGKFFGNFTHEYFPTIEKYNEAKDAWKEIRNSYSIDEISGFLSKYYFTPDIKILLSESYRIGNVGGSAMKLLILFQELVFNAIKYCVFVERDKRFVKFEIRDIDGIINVNIENSFNESAKTKSSGFGHVIIENFAKLLKAEFSIIKKDGKHTVNLSFKNLWRIK